MSKVKELPCTPLTSNHSASESGSGSPARTSRIFWRAASVIVRSGAPVISAIIIRPREAHPSRPAESSFAALDIIAIVSVVAVAVLASVVAIRTLLSGTLRLARSRSHW